MGRFLLLLSIVLVALKSAHVLFIGATGRGIPFFITLAGYLALPCIALAALCYSRRPGYRLDSGWRLKLQFYALLIVVLGAYGWLNGNPLRFIIDDFWIYTYGYLAFLLGTRND